MRKRMASDLDQRGKSSSLHLHLQALSPTFQVALNACTQFAQYENPEEKKHTREQMEDRQKVMWLMINGEECSGQLRMQFFLEIYLLVYLSTCHTQQRFPKKMKNITLINDLRFFSRGLDLLPNRAIGYFMAPTTEEAKKEQDVKICSYGVLYALDYSSTVLLTDLTK